MSLYNLLYGRNTLAECLLPMINLTPDDFPRYRDTYIDDANNDNNNTNNTDYKLIVHTRTGGGNREEYEDDNNELTLNPYYTHDEDDQDDSTYANFYFRIPNEFKGDVDKLVQNKITNINELSENYRSKLNDMMPTHYQTLKKFIEEKK